MKSKMEISKENDSIYFKGILHLEEVPNLSAACQEMLTECGKSGARASDWLLALECLFRNVEEQ